MSEPTRQEIMRAVQYAKRKVTIRGEFNELTDDGDVIEADDETLFDFVHTALEDLGIIK